ncbi:cupin domain-containing protein [Rathayibacter sp. CAU 1779]
MTVVGDESSASNTSGRLGELRAKVADLGPRVRAFRTMRRLSLRRVAEASGITESYLSQIERGTATGSIDVLTRVAAALNLGLSDLFDDTPPGHTPLRSADRPELVSEGVTKYLYTLHPLRHLEVMEAVMAPGAKIGDESHVHGSSQELLLVLAGSVECVVDGNAHRLEAGDSMEYFSSSPHSVSNTTDAEARILYVISPPSI